MIFLVEENLGKDTTILTYMMKHYTATHAMNTVTHYLDIS